MVSSSDDYLACTIKHATNQHIKYDIPDHKRSSPDGRDQLISLAVSRAVIDFMVAGLGYVLRGKPTREVNPPCQGDQDYISQIDEYEFDRSMRLGDGQAWDAPEHVLSAAAYLGNIPLVEGLLDQGVVDLNARSNVFGPPLRNAALRGHFEVVRLLLDRGADPDGGSYPRTEEDHRQVERKWGKDVLERSFPDILDCPGTALEAAARNAHKEIARLLLQQDFHKSRSSPSYRKAIVFAAMGGDADILKMLIRGVDFGTLSDSSLQTYWDRTFRYAAFCGNTETILTLLLDKGAHLNRQYEDEINLGFSTPLGLAAFNGHNETILFLLHKGADINGGSLHPIYMATCRGFARTVALLLDLGAEVHPVYSRFMERAAEYGEADVVRAFLERGLHLMPGRFDHGESALEIARSTGHPRVVRVLEEFGVTDDGLKIT